MIFYLTFNDVYSGIYSSQVIDVVKFQRTELAKKIKLVAFISLRGFLANKRKIKNELPDAIVLPMVPGVHRWRANLISLKVLCLVWKPGIIIGRSVLATQMALKCKNRTRKIVYDGRGAIAAEWKEYGVITNKKMLDEISGLEKAAILLSDKRIAVSEKLVNYWKTEYQYTSDQHVIIPCTLNNIFENVNVRETAIENSRKLLGFDRHDIIFAYSGSVAGWQSFTLLYDFIKPVLVSSPVVKVVFLSHEDENIGLLKKEFGDRIICRYIKAAEIPGILTAADYGLLIREQSVTNKVASPVKFAEYLACGLKVIISENLGDYSEFIFENKCGYLYSQFNASLTKSVTLIEREINTALAMNAFSKNNFINAYKQIVD